MIIKLRRKLMLLVVGALLLVTGGIIFAINFVNLRNIDASANAALSILAENRGHRPDLFFGAEAPEDGETPPPKPEGTIPAEGAFPTDGAFPTEGAFPTQGFRGGRFQGRRSLQDTNLAGSSALASLSNFYTIQLDDDNAVTGWESDRADLYTDEQIQEIAGQILAKRRQSGRVGAQYFRCMEDGRIIVLDARLERLSAQRVLRATALVASLACLVLSGLAWLLISRMLKPVQASFDRQKQFVWDASHEFKTPLAVISANAEVLSEEIGPNEYLGYIQSEVKRTDNLVQNLLTLARMDKGTVTAQMKRFDLSQAVMGVALPFESTVFEAGKTLELDVPEGVFVRGDEAMLQQLTVILLSNALKYSNPGGQIAVRLAPKGKGCVLTVFNTGEGIPRDKLEKIFDRFYRADASHNSEIAGNGLGLAIARTIVEAHKGHIRAESVPGQSATFTVVLP